MIKLIEEYTAEGYSVFPLKNHSKEPKYSWREFQQRRPTHDELNRWFADERPTNVGIVTGAISGIVVLDIDGKEGEESFAGLGDIPPTPTVRTGRGRHLYFKHPGFPVRNSAGLKPGLDIRGDGGYVVAPPSIHPNGSAYEWILSPSDQPLAEWPEVLTHLTDTKCETPRELKKQGSGAEHLCVPRAYKDEIERILGQLAQAKEGRRNDALNLAAFRLGQLNGHGALDADWAQDQLQTIATQIGLSCAEAEATIRSGFEAGVGKPREDLQPFFQILDDVPEVMDRPLRLIDNVAYGATWLPLALSTDDGGKKSQTELVIFTAQGEFFCEADVPGSQPLDDLPIKVELPFKPTADRLLSPAGFKAFTGGERPDPAVLFSQVCEMIDRFVSFQNSLANQQSMTELVACWILSTYLFDAFDVTGYLWPTGEKASGKTQLLNAVTSLSFLGKTTTAGSSFASIRDDANYGATLGFDDCENLRNMEPQKRELLLAGNTRGAVISRKEAVSDTEWRTVSVNNFAPRLFSSIGLPDPVLGSRTISLPLIASLDRAKTRRHPLRPDDWSCDRQSLIDGLWLTAVGHLPLLCEHDKLAAAKSPLEGRVHDVWRAPLAVAHWLQIDKKMDGVWDRLQQLSISYQTQMTESEQPDLLTLAVQAAHELRSEAGRDIAAASTEIAERVNRLANGDEEAWGTGPYDAQRVGAMMGRLGFEKAGHGSKRSWWLTRRKIDETARSRSILLMQPASSEAMIS